ncbi:Acid beta-fructofuranosidase 2, vacuolar [Rosa chinensis]|uniref:Acid beta-fructofuranosidase 2, vacuolar n=1 Tax=Rosa chinensis TaxID=74649 RepID=A0A2P6P852_ROSCH|nr:Acid beta-fructofuranosidase 2, vacuolar [Rosa chinensis]
MLSWQRTAFHFQPEKNWMNGMHMVHFMLCLGLECVDFYPVSKTSDKGLDTSQNGADVKHVVKASLDNDRHDYHALGSYNDREDWKIPDNQKIDVGIGIRYDYGKFYASKTFYDQNKQRRLDIVAEFELDQKVIESAAESNKEFSCQTSGGAAKLGALGPFGLVVLADDCLSERTDPVYFYVVKGSGGTVNTYFCADQISYVPALKGEKLSVRILVDHSIIESFAQGGRTTITTRVYPTQAIYGAARLFLFNNATDTSCYCLTPDMADELCIHTPILT